MAAGVDGHIAGVEHGQFLAVGSHGGQLGGGHLGGAQVGPAHEGTLLATLDAVEVDAAGQPVQRVAVEVQVHGRALVEHPDRVEAVAHHAVGVAPPQRALALGLQPSPLRVSAVVGALEVLVVLGAPHPRDDRPGAMVVRRLLLAGHARRGVEAEPPVDVHAQFVDGHQRPGVHCERLCVEQLFLQGKAGQHWSHGAEEFLGGTQRVPQPPDLLQRGLHGLMPASHQRAAHSRPLPMPPSTEMDCPVM